MAEGKYKRWITPDGLLLLTAWARDGLVDQDIAKNMGINRATLYEYKNKYPNIADALKQGKEPVDILVENALFKRTQGYAYTETTREPVLNKDTMEYELKITKTVVKQVAPDVTAQIFWLKNRKQKEWRDKRDIDLKTEVSNPFEGLTTDALKKLICDE